MAAPHFAPVDSSPWQQGMQMAALSFVMSDECQFMDVAGGGMSMVEWPT